MCFVFRSSIQWHIGDLVLIFVPLRAAGTSFSRHSRMSSAFVCISIISSSTDLLRRASWTEPLAPFSPEDRTDVLRSEALPIPTTRPRRILHHCLNAVTEAEEHKLVVADVQTLQAPCNRREMPRR